MAALVACAGAGDDAGAAHWFAGRGLGVLLPHGLHGLLGGHSAFRGRGLGHASYLLQILKYVLLISLSVGWACEIMVGRLVGAGQLAQADAVVRKGVRVGLLASGGLAVLAAASAPWLMRVFTRDPVIIAMASTLLWMSVALELGRVFNLVVIGALRASGDVHYPVLASALSLLLILGGGSYWLGQHWGLSGIWLAYIVDECLRGGLMWWRWHRRGWLTHAS